ncbi:cyclin-dependent kinase F-4-like [Ipomoea triloba]|uniref:cyclin-dependent kinase F-4-like n=1 Tax=Ipomoea triloba TaxID=35885 RepID=UPI00125E931C|nr:cyclin-dependent kinase F-4-like [Ipomoea triloba]
MMEWSDGLQLASSTGYQFSTVLIPSASEDTINLITSLCSWDPYKRPTVVEVLQQSSSFLSELLLCSTSLRSGVAFARTTQSGWSLVIGTLLPSDLLFLR